jgi:hypothetical protein
MPFGFIDKLRASKQLIISFLEATLRDRTPEAYAELDEIVCVVEASSSCVDDFSLFPLPL